MPAINPNALSLIQIKVRMISLAYTRIRKWNRKLDSIRGAKWSIMMVVRDTTNKGNFMRYLLLGIVAILAGCSVENQTIRIDARIFFTTPIDAQSAVD